MSVYRIKAWFADNDEVYRVIDIRGKQNFEQLHQTILKSVNFDDGQLASFYVADEDWEQGTEITLLEMGDEEDDELLVMKTTNLEDVIGENFSRFVYIYDFVNMWTFHLEVIDTFKDVAGNKYPAIIEEEGEAPVQYDNDPDLEDISDEDENLLNSLRKRNRKSLLFDDDDDFDAGYEDSYSEDFDELDDDSFSDDDFDRH